MLRRAQRAAIGSLQRNLMPHQYKRRTYDEAMELAQEAFRSGAPSHLTAEEIEELGIKGTVSGGSFGADWATEVGADPDKNLHYEYQVYLPALERPYVEKYCARILVTRDRQSKDVWIKWKPPLSAIEAIKQQNQEAEPQR